MADERSRKLFSELGTICGPKWRSYLKDSNIYSALTDAQMDVALKSLCLRQSHVLDLEPDEPQYAASGNVHRITDVSVPATYTETIEPVEPSNWEEILQRRLSGPPQFVTILFGFYTFAPTPLAADEITLWLALKPTEDDVVTEDDPPIIPPDYDECLTYGAAYRLLRKIPNLVDPVYNSGYYEALYTVMITERSNQLSRVQNRNPRFQRKPVHF